MAEQNFNVGDRVAVRETREGEVVEVNGTAYRVKLDGVPSSRWVYPLLPYWKMARIAPPLPTGIGAVVERSGTGDIRVLLTRVGENEWRAERFQNGAQVYFGLQEALEWDNSSVASELQAGGKILSQGIDISRPSD